MKPIGLITDFGTSDHFVGSMKAAILTVNPRASIVDISHAIPPADVTAAAFMLLMSYQDFPKSTIFVVVVDPGVGSDRRPIAVKSGQHYFVGPDNGVLSLACKKNQRHVVIRSLEDDFFLRKPLGSTFHGRDIFGPVAGHLSKSDVFEKLGPVQNALVECRLPPVKADATSMIGTIAAIDHFGNCITSIESSHLRALSEKNLSVAIKGARPFPMRSRYCDVSKGMPLGIIGSAGFLEISIHGGNAAKKFKLKRGDRVRVQRVLPFIVRTTLS